MTSTGAVMRLPEPIKVGLELLNGANLPFNFEDSAPQLLDFIDCFRHAPAPDQAAIREAVSKGNYGRLVGYAQRLASQAIRRNSIEDVKRGLAAVVLEGVKKDFRVTVMALCLLHHSANKLGTNAIQLFEEATQYGSPKAKDFVLQYLAVGNKEIKAMGFEEGSGPEGFKYMCIG